MSGRKKVSRPGRLRFADFFIVVFCLSGAAFSLNLFRNDLFATITLQNEEPVGIVIARSNVVQRRLADRALWGRLAVDSGVFMGDLIRVAELSSATLIIDGTRISLNENTLIRIQRTPDEILPFQIALDEGSLSVNSGEEGGSIVLNLMGRYVEAGPGTVLNAAAGEYGIVLTVSEGTAVFIDIEEGQAREVSSGQMLALDAEGTERTDPAAVVMSPPPDARFLKNTPEPVPVSFAWSRLHLQPYELLRLEIAEDRNFNRIAHVIDYLDDSASAALGAGSWHWRLFFEGAALSAGRITVTEAARPELMSPVRDSTYRFQNDLPSIRFQWSEVEGASSYIFEASSTPDFTGPTITREAWAAFFIDSTMEPGTWYWRVMPVFPPMYEGSAVFSAAAFFHIEQSIEEIEEQLVIELPQPIEITLLSPAQGASLATPPGLAALQQQAVFSWGSDGDEVRSRFILSRSSDPFSGVPAVEIANPPGRTVSLDNLEQGTWYWTVEAQAASGLVSAAEVRQLQVLPAPIGIQLLSPAQGAALPGLAALRQQTVFNWSSNGQEVQSRFIFSRSSDPLSGTPAVVIANPPGRSVSLDRLEQGRWYWVVEAHAPNGIVTVTEPRHVQVLPIPQLPAPGNRLPAQGHRIGIQQLRTQRDIVFSWSAVPGANAYIFALYHLGAGGRRLIQRNAPAVGTNWTLGDISVLDQGTFLWQVEAVNRGVNNAIEQRGIVAENTFVMDFPLPGPVRIEDPGILYGR